MCRALSHGGLALTAFWCCILFAIQTVHCFSRNHGQSNPLLGGVGTNTVDLLWNQLSLSPRGPQQVKESLSDSCQQRNLTLTRFAATPYWPTQVTSTYSRSRQDYWANMSKVVTAAAAAGCRMIPSLFWNWFAFPDVAGEPLGDAMRNTSSRTRAMWAEYIRDFTTMFANEPTIVAWELGNELNLIADLDLSEQQPAIAPSMGTPTQRTRADNFSTADMMSFQSWLVDTIRQYDTMQRPISTGHAVPRPQAQHLRSSYFSPQRDWTPDTEDEYEDNLRDVTQCCEIMSLHYYPGAGAGWGWGNITDPNSTLPLRVAFTVAADLGKTFYVGEFGDADPGPRPFSHSVLKTLNSLYTYEEGGAAVMATIWVWEFYQFSPTVAASFSILPGRDDEMIAALEAANRNISFWSY